MSLIRSCLILSAAIMLLPVEEKKQTELTHTLASTAERTATYCERNPSTCQAGRELWSTFVRKAEYATELGARLVREQLVRAMTETREPAPAAQPAPTAAAQPAAPAQAVRYEPVPAARAVAQSQVGQSQVGQSQVPQSQVAQPQVRRQSYPMDNPTRWRPADSR